MNPRRDDPMDADTPFVDIDWAGRLKATGC